MYIMKGNWLRRQRSNPGRRQILPRNITINNLDKRRAFRGTVTLMYHMRNRHKGEYVTYLKLWEIYISIILLITKVFYWHKIKYAGKYPVSYNKCKIYDVQLLHRLFLRKITLSSYPYPSNGCVAAILCN